MLQAGIELRAYHRPQILRPQALTRRLHDKLLCRDCSDLIVGSRNLAAGHFGRAECATNNYVDVDIRVCGAVAAAAAGYFDELWESRELTPVTAGSLARRRHGQLLHYVRRHLKTRPRGAVRRTCGQAEPLLEFEPLDVGSGCAQFLCDPGGRKCRSSGVHVALYDLLESARYSIVLESPYLVPDAEFARVLRAALARNVRVRILTNSCASTNHLIVYPAYRDMIWHFQKLGAEVWEATGPEVFHAKTVVVDERIAAVVSFNFDPRSAYLDTQTGVVVFSPLLAAQLLVTTEVHLQSAVPVRFPEGPIADRVSWLRSPWYATDASRIGPARRPLLRCLSHILLRQL
jgi:putative cardiolipin synthase